MLLHFTFPIAVLCYLYKQPIGIKPKEGIVLAKTTNRKQKTFSR